MATCECGIGPKLGKHQGCASCNEIDRYYRIRYTQDAVHRYLADHGPAPVSEIVRATGYAKSSVLAALNSHRFDSSLQRYRGNATRPVWRIRY